MTIEVEKVGQGGLRGWDGYRLRAGDLSVGVAPDIGGRIVSLTHRGEELFFVQEEHAGEVLDLDGVDLREEKRRLGFRLWGGDKTWVSPQGAWWEGVPPLELDGGRYVGRVEGKSVVVESPVCRETGLRVIRRVRLGGDGEVHLDQELVNEGRREARNGIWDVTQCLRPFDVYVQAGPGAIRGYPDEGDSVALRDRLVRDSGGWTTIPCRKAVHFKFGGPVTRGVLLALREDSGETLMFLRSFEIDPRGVYAHEGAMVEVYNSPKYPYLEIEVHAPLVPLAPGSRVRHAQRWRFARLAGAPGPDDALRQLGE